MPSPSDRRGAHLYFILAKAPKKILCWRSARINKYSAIFGLLTVRRATPKLRGESFAMIHLFAPARRCDFTNRAIALRIFALDCS